MCSPSPRRSMQGVDEAARLASSRQSVNDLLAADRRSAMRAGRPSERALEPAAAGSVARRGTVTAPPRATRKAGASRRGRGTTSRSRTLPTTAMNPAARRARRPRRRPPRARRTGRRPPLRTPQSAVGTRMRGGVGSRRTASAPRADLLAIRVRPRPRRGRSPSRAGRRSAAAVGPSIIPVRRRPLQQPGRRCRQPPR